MEKHFNVVIVGGGSAGIATAASLAKRDRSLEIAIVDPADQHFYQPGWTMVGGGIFDVTTTGRPQSSVIPRGCTWFKQSVEGFDPENNAVHLGDGSRLHYDRLVVCPGLKLNWAGVEGLETWLGTRGVTSNYSSKTAPYTWKLVQSLKKGKALFTQPPMPIKCAGAPQKAMYLSADHWTRSGLISDIDVQFYTATPGLFGVQAYVPALMKYVERYGASLNFQHTLTAIDGDKQNSDLYHRRR